MRVSFAILGPPVITAGCHRVPIDGPMVRAVAAALLLAGDQPVSVAALTQALWDRPPRSAASNLRTYITRLRAALQSAGPDLDGRLRAYGRGGGYQLAASVTETDARLFITLAGRGRALLRDGQATQAAAALSAACALWRGPAAASVTGGGVTGTAAWKLAGLDEQRLIAREDYLDARLSLGESASLLDELRELTRGQPLRERPWAQLIVALYRTGDLGGALATYQRARSVLVAELGIEPGDQLRHLQTAILRRDAGHMVRWPAPGRLPARSEPSVKQRCRLRPRRRMAQVMRSWCCGTPEQRIRPPCHLHSR
jgi:DNA-binding SARP family transcriptional activator